VGIEAGLVSAAQSHEKLGGSVPRRLGQHFLISESILNRIALAVCPEPAPLIVEIGPGKGALTAKLLERADRVIAIELDESLVDHLRTRFAGQPLEVVHADVLDIDLGAWGAVPIAGNLPYYITSPILEKAVRANAPRTVFLMQKEVAQRLTAKPGARDYGYLTVQTALFARSRILFDVKPGAFRPPPKVDSSVVLLEPRLDSLQNREEFLEFVGRCFRQKRKTMRNNLAGFYSNIDTLPEAGMRAEQLSLEQLLSAFLRVHLRPTNKIEQPPINADKRR
jgi:16S rRNA (adenine1518-N6/adenine1519-N6)-dimethyltransferase